MASRVAVSSDAMGALSASVASLGKEATGDAVRGIEALDSSLSLVGGVAIKAPLDTVSVTAIKEKKRFFVRLFIDFAKEREITSCFY